MKLTDDLRDRYLWLIEQIYCEGYRAGFENGKAIWSTEPVEPIKANEATHDQGTPQAPLNETWEEMRAREKREGAK